MSFTETILLGAIAGITIYAGLPLARMQPSPRVRVALAMFSVGVLAFLLIDVLGHGYEETEAAVEAFGEHEGSFGHALGLTALLLGGFTLGSLGIGLLERRIRRASCPRWRLSAGAGIEEAFRYGVAAGTAALLTPGTELARKDDTDRLYCQVDLTELSQPDRAQM